MRARQWPRVSVLVASTVLALLGLQPAAAAESVPQPVSHQLWNGLIGPLTSGASEGAVSPGAAVNPSNSICSTQPSAASNVNTDCEGTNPHNETTIAVNPTNPSNMIGSANDYQLTLSPGGTVFETIFSRAHVTFDAGKSWTLYELPLHGYAATGDAAVAFDADGTAYAATLGFVWSQGNFCCVNPDIVVSHSTDGGKTWADQTAVAHGSGIFSGRGVFNDKEYIAAWGHGNAIVTWTVFNQGAGGSYISSPIFASVTHDSGRTWSTGTAISGSAPFCVGAQGGNACDQDQASVPVVAADGSIAVAFENTADNATGRDQYLVVKVDPQSGQRVAGPFRVASLVDGLTDYPINVDGRPTYQDSQFRSWSAGNITADPTDAGHLAVVWSDMRNSTLPAPADPYAATTNSDVVISQSRDGGATWSAPVAITAPGDQFMPWGAYDASGRLRIGYFDRSADPANHLFGYTLATEKKTGALTFTTAPLTTAMSDPTRNDRWFAGRTPNPAFPHPSTFIGDYSGIAATPSGGVVGLWTDMRNPATFGTRTGHGEDAYFGAHP